MRVLTVSQLKTFRRCARLHDLEYQQGYRLAVADEALRFGDLFHLGLAAWWTTLAVDQGEVLLIATLDAIAGRAEDAFEQVRLEELLRGYHYRWLDAGLVPLAVEREFRAPLVNPETGAPSKTWQLAGKLDVIAREPSGRVVIVEHKTSSEDLGIGSTYWLRLRMDSQVSMYFDGAVTLGHDVGACIYDVVGKVALRPLKATPLDQRKYTKATKDQPSRLYANQREDDETPAEYRARVREEIATYPERYYQRGEVVRLEQDLADHRFDIWQQGRIIRESELAGRAPRNPDSCSMYGRTCAFFSICSGTETLEHNPRFQKVSNVHPELGGDKAA